MKPIALILFTTLAFVNGCKSQTEQQERSASYKEIEPFLKAAGVTDASLIYFYVDTPRFPVPNVYCFNEQGVQLEARVHNPQGVKEYVYGVGKRAELVKQGGQKLEDFLLQRPIANAYDSIITIHNVGKYDYYLFVDFLAIPDPDLQEMVSKTKKLAGASQKRIRLFLVHTVSFQNREKFKGKSINISDRNSNPFSKTNQQL